MLTLEKGESYLVKTRGGHIYLGEFVGCERHKYVGSTAKRKVEVFKDAYFITCMGNLSRLDYLHMIAHKIEETTKVEFDSSKFLNMSRPELELYFKGNHS